ESVQRGGGPVLRFYTWSPACLSLGRNQPARGLYDTERAAAAGIDIVRRPTGGLAVLHDREITYCVLGPLDLFGGPRAAYATINRALVIGLRRIGVGAMQAVDAGPRGPLGGSPAPCFQSPAAGEVVVRGRKLVGSAQRCERGALLQHGSILLSGSQARVLDLLAGTAPDPRPPDGAITLEELLGSSPAVPEVVDALCGGFSETFGTPLAPRVLDDAERVRADALVDRYRAVEWTWRL
ncbi:MAG TPA: biotin/lipoate A/B protein ligase family protein, partial [Longimicrobiales bacterium]|nr:biotin/lipoate A/B protein ligase family protein [Longimicrobiales bacterium]